ncbi:MAG: DUF456 domain-containing protein [Candidatus Anammoxibacter sp.]
MDPWSILFLVISLLIMLTGLVGIIFPVIPSTPLIWVGTFIYVISSGFEDITWNVLIVFGILTAFTLIADFFANMYGAKRFGASKWGIIGSTVGMIIGTITTGVVGLIVGSFLGAVVFELLAGRQLKVAFNSGLGAFIGFLGGSLIKLIIGFVMVGVFIWKII